MVKGVICVTSLAMPSGEGVPMHSRNGKSTIPTNMCFKEPHPPILEKDIEVPEEVLREQLRNDLKGEETDVFKQYLEKQFLEREQKNKQDNKGKQKEKIAEMDDRLMGARGNLSMFRSVPRERINARDDMK